MASRSDSGRLRTVSASELADYAFCPRSHYYRLHPAGRRPAEGSVARERAGLDYHRVRIGSDRRWARASPLPWALALLVGAAVLGWLLLGALS